MRVTDSCMWTWLAGYWHKDTGNAKRKDSKCICNTRWRIKMSAETKNYTEIDGIRNLSDLLDRLGKIQETLGLV